MGAVGDEGVVGVRVERGGIGERVSRRGSVSWSRVMRMLLLLLLELAVVEVAVLLLLLLLLLLVMVKIGVRGGGNGQHVLVGVSGRGGRRGPHIYLSGGGWVVVGEIAAARRGKAGVALRGRSDQGTVGMGVWQRVCGQGTQSGVRREGVVMCGLWWGGERRGVGVLCRYGLVVVGRTRCRPINWRQYVCAR